jgi:multidrug efflux pump subunit AcrA (membrane-fusion protein)
MADMRHSWIGLVLVIGCGGEVPADGGMQRIELGNKAHKPGDKATIDSAVAAQTGLNSEPGKLEVPNIKAVEPGKIEVKQSVVSDQIGPASGGSPTK